MCLFVDYTNLLFSWRKCIYNRALFVGPFLKRSCRREIKPHCPAFMPAIKASPTLEKKKWPQLPCLAELFTALSADSIVQRLHSVSGASVWVAEGNIELSVGGGYRGLLASCVHPSPLMLLSLRGRLHWAMESSRQTRSRSFVSERVTFAKGKNPLSWE